jgi:hypothetical protein
MTEHLRAKRSKAFGNLVDGGRGDDEHPEEGEQDEQGDGDQRAAEQVGDHRGPDVADGASRFAHRLLATARPWQAVLDVNQAEHTQRDRGPADDRPSRGAAPARPAHDGPGRNQEQQGYDVRRDPHGPLDDRSDRVADGAVEPPPLGSTDDDGEADETEPESVSTVLRVEIAGGGPDPPDDCAEQVGEAEPESPQTAAEGSEQP